jgi:hypothetical protein
VREEALVVPGLVEAGWIFDASCGQAIEDVLRALLGQAGGCDGWRPSWLVRKPGEGQQAKVHSEKTSENRYEQS